MLKVELPSFNLGNLYYDKIHRIPRLRFGSWQAEPEPNKNPFPTQTERTKTAQFKVKAGPKTHRFGVVEQAQNPSTRML